jgi:hypothetical protein
LSSNGDFPNAATLLIHCDDFQNDAMLQNHFGFY